MTYEQQHSYVKDLFKVCQHGQRVCVFAAIGCRQGPCICALFLACKSFPAVDAQKHAPGITAVCHAFRKAGAREMDSKG